MALATGMPPMLRMKRSTQSGSKVATAVYANVYSESSTQAWAFFGGYLDLSTMLAGDTVDIRIRKTLASGGGMMVEDTLSYSGARPAGHTVVEIGAAPNVYGVEIAIRQTAGVLRTLLCEFFDAKRLGLD